MNGKNICEQKTPQPIQAQAARPKILVARYGKNKLQKTKQASQFSTGDKK
jgi:hypothetical protein